MRYSKKIISYLHLYLRFHIMNLFRQLKHLKLMIILGIWNPNNYVYLE